MGLVEQLDYSIQLVAGLAIFKLRLRLIELKARFSFTSGVLLLCPLGFVIS